MRIERQTLAQQVLDRLIVRLTEKNYQPGDKLATEQELMEEFMVSRSSVREAIKALQNLGILESRPARGTFISTQKDTYARLLIFASLLSEDSRGDLSDFQGALETEALYSIYQNLQNEDSPTHNEDRTVLRESHDQLSRALAASKHGRHPEGDLLRTAHQVRLQIIGLLGENLLAKICTSLLEFLQQKLWAQLSLSQMTRLFEDYLAILNVLLEGKSEDFFERINDYQLNLRNVIQQLSTQTRERAFA